METTGSKDLSSGWSDRVEDLVDTGDVDGAISLLESVVSNLGTLGSSSSSSIDDLRLASALGDLADLQSSRGYSLKADELRSQALLARYREPTPPNLDSSELGSLEMKKARGQEEQENGVCGTPGDHQEEDDDWEAIADHEVSGEALLSSRQGETSSPSHAGSSLKENPKRRGRGSFLYQKSCLYSDQPDIGATFGSVSMEEAKPQNRLDEDEDSPMWNLRYGTGHVIVLYDFSPTTCTIDLEKLFDNFGERDYAIRWVNDTTALAVFQTPAIAHHAKKTIQFPFKVRQLEEEDAILTCISRRELCQIIQDLEPPVPRPKTSARTAQRLIAHGMGIRLNTNFGFNELRKQEDARKNRIRARQAMKDDAWGPD